MDRGLGRTNVVTAPSMLIAQGGTDIQETLFQALALTLSPTLAQNLKPKS